jgi:16S rRNA (uracil1498-N3)-methyltransferase
MTKIFVRQNPNGDFFRLNRAFRKRLTKVMRLGIGDELQVFGEAKQWQCKVIDISQHEIVLQVVKELTASERSGLQIVIGQAIAKGEKRFESLIEKATQLGASEIFPLITERTIVRPANVDAKMQRWNEISHQAAGQSENSYPPLIHASEKVEIFAARHFEGPKLLLHERDGAESLHDILQPNIKTVTFAVGPEGGWTRTEVDLLMKSGFHRIHLGPRILRTETAGLALLSILQYQLGDMRQQS